MRPSPPSLCVPAAALILALALAACEAARRPAPADPARPGGKADDASDSGGGRVVARARLSAMLALGPALPLESFDVAGVRIAADQVDLVLRLDEWATVTAAGIALTVVKDDEGPLAARDDLNQYLDPTRIAEAVDAIAAAHPDLARKVVLRDQLFEGHALIALKISDHVEVAEDEPAVLIDAQHHAREVMTPEIAIDAARYLTDNYAADPEIQRLVDGLEIWIVPTANPDGAAHVFGAASYWRRNRHPECAVDLNRNFPFTWRACSGYGTGCWSETNSGTAAGSEPETAALVDLMAEIRPFFYLTYHSYGEVVMWPYGCWRSAEDATFREIAGALRHVLAGDDGQVDVYDVGIPPEVLYEVAGGSRCHAYGAHGTFSFTIEVNRDDFQPDYDLWRDVTVERQRAGWRLLLERALAGPQVQGHVIDAATGAPLAATVQLVGVDFTHGEPPRRTSAFGRYAWPVLPESDVTVAVAAPGYEPQRATTHVPSGVAVLDFALVPVSPAPDAGVGEVDAGVGEVDGGVGESDGGELDAGGGEPDGGELDAGVASPTPGNRIPSTPAGAPPGRGRAHSWQHPA